MEDIRKVADLVLTRLPFPGFDVAEKRFRYAKSLSKVALRQAELFAPTANGVVRGPIHTGLNLS